MTQQSPTAGAAGATAAGRPQVSAKISNSVISGNAFGVFVASANAVAITDTIVETSLADGVIMHRFTTGAVIERTVVRRNLGDGFVLSRASRQVSIKGSTAEGNTGNGFTLVGQPLAAGASASGESTASSGGHSVTDSVARNNVRYGLEILGGHDVAIKNNRVEGGDMGIVATDAADKVTITGNQLAGPQRQAIALRDRVTAAVIADNVADGPAVGVYVRDSVAEVRANTIRNATLHGVTVVGETGGSVISHNTIAGAGPSPINSSRAIGVVLVAENQIDAWHITRPFWAAVRHYVSPMTMLWTSVLLLIVFFGAKGRKLIMRGRARVHPYADKMPIQAAPAHELTRQIFRARGRAKVTVAANEIPRQIPRPRGRAKVTVRPK
jgi:hypothetical protein